MPVMDAFKQTSACPTDSVVSIKARHAEPVPNSHKTPAPGAYSIPGGIGEKAGVYKRAKGGRFGKERRGQDPEDREKACKPGPKYSLGSTMGRQMLSTRPGSPATKMGGRYSISPKVDESFTCRADSFLRPSSSPNAPWAPQYTMAHKVSPIKADHADNPGPGAFDLEKYTKVERTRYGCPVTIKVRHGAKDRTDGPGPMRCRTDSGFGRQVVSTQKNGPACSFGRRGRARKLDDGGPGPGAYARETDKGKQLEETINEGVGHLFADAGTKKWRKPSLAGVGSVGGGDRRARARCEKRLARNCEPYIMRSVDKLTYLTPEDAEAFERKSLDEASDSGDDELQRRQRLPPGSERFHPPRRPLFGISRRTCPIIGKASRTSRTTSGG